MTDIKVTVRVEIDSIGGERQVFEQARTNHTQDNPRFWGRHAKNKADELSAVVWAQIEHTNGRPPETPA